MTDQSAFRSLGLSSRVLRAINNRGFEEPTEIQAMTIPVILEGKTDIIAQAQTGTGKTAAFGLPLIELIDTRQTTVQALVLVPTRELAIQVAEEINSLRGEGDLTIVPIYGGQSIDQQLRRLKKGVHVVVGTPGRIIDHIKRKTLKLGDITHLVLDEADEMLNMGFIDDIEEILSHTNPSRRTTLFSATMPAKIRELARKYMDGYQMLTVKKQQLTTSLTDQVYFEVKASDKFEALCRIVDMEDGFYGLVFCRTRNDVDGVVSHLTDRGYDAEALHGEISQSQRERTLDNFRKKNINILVATDVAARGLDVYNLTHVINYSIPQDPESYVHRIGRTGRAGMEGTAITFITPGEYKKLMFIQSKAGADIKKSSPPNVKNILKARRRKIYNELADLLEKGVDERYYRWANTLMEGREPADLVAALLEYSFDNNLNPDNYSEIQKIQQAKKRDRSPRTRVNNEHKRPYKPAGNRGKNPRKPRRK